MKLPGGISQSDAQKINDLENFSTRYKWTWQFKKFINMPFKIIALFTGNQAMKTSGICYQYILRLYSWHPIPKKNVLYFECPRRTREDIAPHGYFMRKEPNGIIVPSYEKGTFNKRTLPKDGLCPYCGEKLRIHKRNSRVFRMCSETLPGDKEETSKDGTQSAETKNTVYPELKKWMPRYLIKRDIRFRNPAMIVRDPYSGMEILGEKYIGDDIVFDFVSYQQSVQAGAGVQRMGIFLDEESPKDFFNEQLPRLLVEDGDILMGLTPANGMCFDIKTRLLTKRGWLGCYEIKMSDEVMAYNIEADRMEWSPIYGFYFNVKYSGKMMQMKHNAFDALVTPEHKWVVCNDRRHNEKFLEKTKKLNTKHIITRLVKNVVLNEDNNEVSDNLIALLGWIVTDGSIGKDNHNIVIYQSASAYPKHCKNIDKLCQGVEHRAEEREYHGGGCISWNGSGIMRRWYITGEDRKRLLKYIEKDKSIKESFICSLSKRQLEILFNAMIDGDGNRRDKGAIVFTQTYNERLCDNFLLISILLGRLAKKGTIGQGKGQPRRHAVWVYAEGKRFWPNTHVKSLTIDEVQYEGPVWCPTTRYGTLVMERNGCVSISGNSWTYDEIFEKAQVYYRTKKVCEFLDKDDPGRKHDLVERMDNNSSIGVIQASTYDNPTLSKEIISEMFDNISDPEELATRCYGIHKQISGRIFKQFDYRVHYIKFEKYFPNGMFHSWNHYRMIDYHPHNPWACVWLSISPQNEAFVWREFMPNPEKMTTMLISNEIANMSEGYRYKINLIDPLAKVIQTQTGTSTVDDLNQYFMELRKEGICTGGFWESWDTKGTRGREVIRLRLSNALKAGKPFNNKMLKHGAATYQPTLWICDTCKEVARSLKHWRLEQWANRQDRINKERKEKPSDKHSHFCTALEAVFKDDRCVPAPLHRRIPQDRSLHYFQGRRQYG